MKVANALSGSVFTAEHRSRLEELCIPEPNSGCWIWIGAYSDKTGYGSFSAKGAGNFRAHRASYAMFKSDIPATLVIRHKCDNTFCVNPDHLEAGTQQQNVQDSIARGRFSASRARGLSKVKRDRYSRKGKLTLEMAKAIFDSYGKAKDDAVKFGVSFWTVKAIRSGREWPEASEGRGPHYRSWDAVRKRKEKP